MDYAALKALKPSAYREAAHGYQAAKSMAHAAKDALNDEIMAAMRKSLNGEAADAALGELGELSKNFAYIQTECAMVVTELRAVAASFASAKKALDEALADAESAHFTVGDDGSVSYPAGGDKVDGKTPEGGTAVGASDELTQSFNRQAANMEPNPNYGRAQAIADRILQAVESATKADEKAAPVLDKLRADDDLTVSDADWADAQDDMKSVRKGAKDYLDHIKHPPKHGTAEDNADWWKHLSQQDREDYVAMHPAAVGAMDGLPAEVRDEANRTVLNEKHGQYQLALDHIPKAPPKWGYGNQLNPDWVAWNKKYAGKAQHYEDSLKGMNAIQKRFDSTGRNGLPEAYLLGFDPEKDGRAIVATGNPDTADHTAVYVPGTGSDLKGIGTDIDRGSALWRQSHKLSPHDNISAITWMNYDAPDDIPAATKDKYAAAAGPTLRHFLDGNAAAHEAATGGRAHTTLIGHSYGSTVAGDAAKSPGEDWFDNLKADDVVAVGSPGMQAKRAVDLGIDPKHMWAEKSDGWDDWGVREGGRLMGLGGDSTIPTDKDFGGHVMESDAPDHGGYWNESKHGKPSVSLENQARVVVGDYDGVKLE